MMASDTNSAPAPLPGTTPAKLPPLAQGSKIQKRPLTRRQLPASSKSPVIYVSSKTPFMSAVSRVRKHLEKSTRGSSASGNKGASLHSRIEALKRDTAAPAGAAGAVVAVVGTGKAVEKVLALASWFEQAGDCAVEIRTKTVGTVDDVVDGDGEVEDEGRVRKMSCLEALVRLK